MQWLSIMMANSISLKKCPNDLLHVKHLSTLYEVMPLTGFKMIFTITFFFFYPIEF